MLSWVFLEFSHFITLCRIYGAYLLEALCRKLRNDLSNSISLSSYHYPVTYHLFRTKFFGPAQEGLYQLMRPVPPPVTGRTTDLFPTDLFWCVSAASCSYRANTFAPYGRRRIFGQAKLGLWQARPASAANDHAFSRQHAISYKITLSLNDVRMIQNHSRHRSESIYSF